MFDPKNHDVHWGKPSIDFDPQSVKLIFVRRHLIFGTMTKNEETKNRSSRCWRSSAALLRARSSTWCSIDEVEFCVGEGERIKTRVFVVGFLLCRNFPGRSFMIVRSASFLYNSRNSWFSSEDESLFSSMSENKWAKGEIQSHASTKFSPHLDHGECSDRRCGYLRDWSQIFPRDH